MATLRIGEILVAQNKLRATELARALSEQPHTGRRLCSLLIGRGLLDFDDAARALSAQKGVPCALRKHLDHRDRALESAIPGALGRSMCALPIARTRSGQLIVVARDPGPSVEAALAQQIREKFVLIVAPAQLLEQVVGEVYGAVPVDELDVDMTSGPIPRDLVPPDPDMALLDPDSIQLALTSLDDDRVTKDPSQSGHTIPAFTTLPPPVPKKPQPEPAPEPAPDPDPASEFDDDIPLEADFSAATPAKPAARNVVPLPPTFDTMTRLLDRASHRDEATDHALAYMPSRWTCAVVLALRGAVAVGYRGYGEALPALGTIALPLRIPSMVLRAIESRRTSVSRPASAAQQQLEAMLGHPELPAAAPVLVGGHVVAVIAVGDPSHGPGDFEDATADLSLVAEALSGAYERIHGTR